VRELHFISAFRYCEGNMIHMAKLWRDKLNLDMVEIPV
jgi:hypothetical protein